MKFVLSFIALIAFQIGEAQVVFPGPCRDVPTMPNFDASQYLGKWYEDERFFFITEYDEDCVSANYSLKADGKVKVVNQGVIIGTSQVDEAVGEAYAPDPNFPAKLLVIFGGPPSNYWVLDTDYKTYTVVWSCRDTKTRQAHTEVTWILSRDRSGISEDRKMEIYNLLKKYNIDTSKFQKVNQKNCII